MDYAYEWYRKKEASLSGRISCTVMQALTDPVVTSQAEMVLRICLKLMQGETFPVLLH